MLNHVYNRILELERSSRNSPVRNDLVCGKVHCLSAWPVGRFFAAAAFASILDGTELPSGCYLRKKAVLEIIFDPLVSIDMYT